MELEREQATPGLVVRPMAVEPANDPAELVRFAFVADRARPFDETLGLDFLGGSLTGESWGIGAAIEQGEVDGLRFARSDDFVFAALDWPDGPEADAAEVTYRAYRRMIDWIRQQSCQHWLRAWNFLPAINRGEGDQERYRQFCVGRARALIEAGLCERSMCAATAIGGDEAKFRLQVLAGRLPGEAIENPRQVSAYDYPRDYGPRSPAFARATALRQPDGEVVLLVSGTASVVGHETRHDGDTLAQLDEILINLDALLSQSARQLAHPDLEQAADRGGLLRVYLRDGSDWPAVQAHLARRWPSAHLAGLRGDVCRADLLVEIEAVFRA